MGKVMMTLGVALMALPFGVMFLEWGFARLTHATGEHLAAAGVVGVCLAFFLIPAGAILLLVGLIVWCMER